MWLEHHSELLQFICKLHQPCCRWVGGRFQAKQIHVLTAVRIVASNSCQGMANISFLIVFMSDESPSYLGHVVWSGQHKIQGSCVLGAGTY